MDVGSSKLKFNLDSTEVLMEGLNSGYKVAPILDGVGFPLKNRLTVGVRGRIEGISLQMDKRVKAVFSSVF